jgi:hypothetical protein
MKLISKIWQGVVVTQELMECSVFAPTVVQSIKLRILCAACQFRIGGDIRMALGEVGWGDMYWMCLAWDGYQWQALVNMVMGLWV